MATTDPPGDDCPADDPRFHVVFEHSPIGIVLYEPAGHVTAINPSALAMFGVERAQDVVGLALFKEPNLPPGVAERLRAGESVQLTVPYDFGTVRQRKFYPTSKTGVITLEAHFTPLGAPGSPAGFLLQVQDVTAATLDRSAREAALAIVERSLREKEVLLREVHHRVKNNLQVVSSLLTLQLDRLADEQARRVFRECMDRIHSMALIHQRLITAGDLAYIRMQDYFTELVGHLMESYGIGPGRVGTEVDAGDLRLDIDAAVTCGLIVNELVSNSLKHAFPRDRKGKIRVALLARGDGRVELQVADTGTGFPAELPAGREGGTTGIQLVAILCEQLGGHPELTGEQGMRFQVVFAPRGAS